VKLDKSELVEFSLIKGGGAQAIAPFLLQPPNQANQALPKVVMKINKPFFHFIFNFKLKVKL
jgi:hypothetical protein